MTLTSFASKASFNSITEIEKVEAIAYYLLKIENRQEFDLSTVSEKLISCGFGKPNLSRLKSKVNTSRSFIKGSQQHTFRLHNGSVEKVADKFPFLSDVSEVVETIDSVIPKDLYEGTRGFIVKLAIQINASFENNISDGCAVLMRRLIEILLILGYQAKGKEQEIKDGTSGAYRNLSSIIDHLLSNNIMTLQKDTREVLHDFRELGNFSAHGITYNCRKSELSKIARKYRLAVEDLLYASELKK